MFGDEWNPLWIAVDNSGKRLFRGVGAADPGALPTERKKGGSIPTLKASFAEAVDWKSGVILY
ncbi:MAG: hypothetical protein AB2792_18790 [Candidatus Thiodiazotropha sp.]